jgi:hypothetical protein
MANLFCSLDWPGKWTRAPQASHPISDGETIEIFAQTAT